MTAPTKGRSHRPSFGRIERALPETGSEEARLLRHILRCELCTEVALSILELGATRAPKSKAPDYDAAIKAATAKATWLFERKEGKTR